MNKYELALVVNAKIEDDERAAAVEKAKELIARFGGTVTEVGCRKEETCIRDPENERRILLLHSVRCSGYLPGRDRETCPHSGQCHPLSVCS